MKQRLTKPLGLALMLALTAPVQAETITIGKGKGIVWEGMPFNQTLSGAMAAPLTNSALETRFGLLAISNYKGFCAGSSILKMIGGYLALPLSGVPGVGLIPRASGTATYTRADGSTNSMTGTIGLPETKASSTTATTITPKSGLIWCLPPQNTDNPKFFSPKGPRTATMSGTWALVADGTQKAGVGTVPPMYFGSYSAYALGDKYIDILPTNIDLRISTLECTVNTPTTVNFGPVSRNTQANAELAVKPVPLVTTCGQASDFINANINLQFRAVSGLYNGAPSQLALNQGGGYITGEIDGVTGSGACAATTGLRFDNTPVKIGDITSAETSKTLTQQLTWRLCSGGNSLPKGAVNASTEMLVTFN